MSEKHSAAMRRRWLEPEYRAAKLSEMSRPQFLERKRAGIRTYWNQPTVQHHALGLEHKATKKATTRPNLRDLEWAAGFLEGEGTFNNTTAAKRRAATQVSAVQVNAEPLERLLTLFGGSICTVKRKDRRPEWHQTLAWRASGGRARGIAMTLYALMSAKRQSQIRAALYGH